MGDRILRARRSHEANQRQGEGRNLTINPLLLRSRDQNSALTSDFKQAPSLSQAGIAPADLSGSNAMRLRPHRPTQRPGKQEWRTTAVLGVVAIGLFALLVLTLIDRYD
jgi:hypothetical protein